MSEVGAEIIVPAQLLGTRRERVALAPLYEALAGLVGALPSYRDTTSGRKRAKTLKIILGVVGLVVMLAMRHTWPMILLGVVLMASAIFIPVEALRQRTAVNALKRRRHNMRQTTRPARLVHDGRRLVLYDGAQRDRRVLTNRRFKLQRHADPGGRGHWVEIAPNSSKKKREAIWLHLPDEPAPEGAPPVNPGRVDAPVTLEAQAAGQLMARLEAAHTHFD